MPKSKSKLGLSQRRERAFQLFARGYTDVDVRKDLGVAKDTVAGYRRQYEANISAQATANSELLSQVIGNTMRSLQELDMIRADAWQHMESRTVRTRITCPHCEEEFIHKLVYEVSDQTRAQYHNVLLKAQGERTKLFGLIGVKQEMMARYESINALSQLILAFMVEELCNADRLKVADLVEKHMAAHGGMPVVLELDPADSEEIFSEV